MRQRTDDAVAAPTQQETQTLIDDGIRLLHFVARSGDLTINPLIAEGIVSAKDRQQTRHWGVEDEAKLLRCYDELARQVFPVTIESIKAVVPSAANGLLDSPRATRTITWYRRYTVFTLLLLLIIQMYYLFGYGLLQILAPSALADVPQQIPQTEAHSRLQASYHLLVCWNRVWMLGYDLSTAPSASQQTLASSTQPSSTQPSSTQPSSTQPPSTQILSAQPLSAHESPVPTASSITFATHIIAAQSVLQMLQNYILPLIYGLLGAFIFVLRSLLQQVRTLTYTASREVGYRLRLTLGCLAGMITGWLLKPEMGDMTLSPMALAFIAGYSIEVLFTGLDRMIDSIRHKPTPSPTSPSSSH